MTEKKKGGAKNNSVRSGESGLRILYVYADSPS